MIKYSTYKKDKNKFLISFKDCDAGVEIKFLPFSQPAVKKAFYSFDTMCQKEFLLLLMLEIFLKKGNQETRVHRVESV